MKKTIIYWTIFILLTMAYELKAQQGPVFSQYMFNKFALNPAVAGSEGYTAFSVTSRMQWLGFKEAPVTNSVSYQTRLVKSRFNGPFYKQKRYEARERGKLGLGFYLYNDTRGLLKQTSGQFTYAYHQVMDQNMLSFGLSINLTHFSVNAGELKPFETDNYLDNGKLSVFIPDFNFGVYYTTEAAYLGFSIAQLFQSAGRFGGYEDNNFILLRNYNAMGGYRFDITKEMSLEPSFQLKANEKLNYQIDAGVRMYFKDQLWGGLAYRTGSALVVTLGGKVNKLFFGYAYDFALNGLQNHSFGTNELIVCYKIAKNARKYKWIERF